MQAEVRRAVYLLDMLTTSVLAPAPYLRNMRLLRLFAVFATVLAPFFRKATAGRVRTFIFALFFRHVCTSFDGDRGESVVGLVKLC